MLVVSDTSPISALFQIGQLDLLPRLFGKIILPKLVFDELMRLEDFGHPIHILGKLDWIEVRSPPKSSL